jgi:hypothetical protein
VKSASARRDPNIASSEAALAAAHVFITTIHRNGAQRKCFGWKEAHVIETIEGDETRR